MSSALVGRKQELAFVPVDKIIKNERNPRQEGAFTDSELASLRASIETHGILQPLMVQPYDNDMFLLLEGERRWTVAKKLGIKEVPAQIVKRMDEHNQVVTMFHVHTQRKGWEMAEELNALRELMERNGRMTEDELAKELGISVPTLRDRLQVLKLGPEVITQIAKDEVDYSSVLRADQVARGLAKKRPVIAQKLGGEKGVREHLLAKAKARRHGISQELVQARRDLTEDLPDDLVEEYIVKPKMTIKDVRRQTESLEERRKVENLSKDLKRIEREIKSFQVDFASAPNLRELRGALATLISAAQDLERTVITALHVQDGPSR